MTLLSRKSMQAWIECDANNAKVEVSIAPLGHGIPKQLLLSTRVNLNKELIDTMYFGFSAATGALTSYRHLLGWSFNSNGKAENLDLSKLPSLPIAKAPKKKVSRPLVALFTVVSVLLIVLTAAAYAIRRKKYEEVMEEWEEEYVVQRFSYRNLYQATKGV